jgi:hypothetical protein
VLEPQRPVCRAQTRSRTSAPAYGAASTKERRYAQVLFGTRDSREFFFRKGVPTPNAPAGQAALDWLAQKARDHPAQLIEGKPYHFPHTREVFRKIVADIYNPPRLTELAQGQEPTPAMSDLNHRFCYRTKGNSVDFESKAYKATIVVSLGHQGSTVTLDLDGFVISDKVPAHANMVDQLLTGVAPADLDEVMLKECVAKDGKAYALLHPALSLRLHVFFPSHSLRGTTSRATSSWRWTRMAKASSPSRPSARGTPTSA